MKSKLRSSTILILFLFSIRLFGQERNDYEKEEINVINSLLMRIINIDGNKIDTVNSVDSLIVYFDKKLKSNLENTTLYDGNYKQNIYISRLKNNYLGEIIIDDSKINKLGKIKLIFEDKVDYSLEKYDLKGVIGTFNMSRISFDRNLITGYFYFRVYCGEDCGWGGLVKVVKKNKSWTIGKYLTLFVN